MAILTAVGMFIVLLMGARVTATGSGEGCGNDWPLCHGSWLPADTYESLTEYSHRVVTSIEGLFVLATAILAWPLRKKHPEFKLLVPLVGGSLIVQSLMGAAAVMWPQTPSVMATHFGISLICLGSAALVAFILIEAKHERPRERPIPPGSDVAMGRFRKLLIVTFLFSIIVAYSGAYVRHTGSELACTTWPACTEEIVPPLEHSPQGIHAMHRVLAGVITVMIAGIAVMGWRLRSVRPDLNWIGVASLAVVIGQSLVGAWVVYSGLALMAALSHAALMSILFVALAEGVRRTWPSSSTRSAVGSGAFATASPAPGD